MNRIDLRPIKATLRDKYKMIRKNIDDDEKQKKDNDILNRLISLRKYKESKVVLTFVSTNIEVDTHELIKHSLEIGKKVAVPFCVPGTLHMEFYLIDSLSELSSGNFGVLEPEPDPKYLLKKYDDSVCIVPGLAFDYSGFRLGYGKGYYDRFFARYKGFNIGICYNCCMAESLPHGYYDKPVDRIVTEKFVKLIG